MTDARNKLLGLTQCSYPACWQNCSFANTRELITALVAWGSFRIVAQPFVTSGADICGKNVTETGAVMLEPVVAVS